MGRHLTITIASILALAIAGCSGEEEQQTVEPTPTTTTENDQSEKPKPFEDPVVPGKTDRVIAQAPSTLIQTTNPTERVGIVAKGRTDPFDDIISPVITRTNTASNNTENNNQQRTVPALPPLRTSSRNTASRARRSAVISATAQGSRSRNYAATQGRNTKVNSNSARVNSTQIPKQAAKKPNSGGTITPTGVIPRVMPGVIPQPDLASVLPPPPQPTLAQAVLVSGVIQVGSQPQAIIKVPTEPTSRYVQAGQRLASGLLVKRIEMNEGSEPIVILEQYGIEVARMVGEAAMGAVEPTTASTSNPVSTLPSLPKPASVGAS
ncbi:hypothetical protein IQ247_12415 [Plectonema cf. radiosum LEGE 06105]|uniref:Uncharacterized protein n=1 Tax=Plectonema cf. radiosum LEGE 06105 TaxID=945769 RepID=A0A8J7FGC6_9CYAN|nr:hypothetical protein [Plectonema radiosum]MBE9213461.1 hypothetical protein [Plectonema cf. radiosum LEGE 06105]